MKVTGVTIVNDAVRLDLPVLAAVRSILPLCHDVIANVGPVDDGTAEALRAVDADRVHILRGEWDPSRGPNMLSVETNRALAEARGAWAVYMQADEVLHDRAIPLLRDAMAVGAGNPRVEGLLVDYVHFYGDVDTIATNRSWYRREVRVVRLGCGVRSYADAQGFRVAPDNRRVRAWRTGAHVFHYGWARQPAAIRHKRTVDATIYHGRAAGLPTEPSALRALVRQIGLRRFRGTHPATAQHWVEHHRKTSPPLDALPLTPRTFRLAAAWALERATGWRPFEYRNYVEVR